MSETLGIIITAIAGVFTTACSSLITFLSTKKKYKVEIKGDEINNFDKALDAYKKMYEDMIGDLKNQIVDLKEENKDLNKRLSDTTNQVITLTNFVLANAIKKADGNLSMEDIGKLKDIIK